MRPNRRRAKSAGNASAPGAKLLADGGGRSLKTDDSEMAPQVVEIAQNGLEEGGLIAA
jgi:hypothetical protein